MTTLTPTRPAPPKEPTLQERATAAKYGDLESYAKAVHGLDIEPYQLAWQEALDEALEEGGRDAIICPPDTFKSSTVQFWIEKAIGRNPNLRVLWLMNAGEQSEKRVMTIGQTLKSNRVYRAAFPGIEEDPDAQWTKTVLYVKRDIDSPDPTLMGCGFNGPYQGLHFDIIIIDDPTNQDEVRSPTTMDIQRLKLKGVIEDRLVDGGAMIAIFTRWGENDLLGTFIQMRFRIIQMPILGDYPWGPTISNRRFPLSKVEMMRHDKGPELFDLTYMCNTSGTESGAIRREHIRYWTNQDLPEHSLAFFMGIDPAASLKSRADYTAIATVGLDLQTKRMYLVDLWAGRLEFPDLIKRVVKMAQQTSGLIGVGVETKGYQLSIVQYLKRNYHLPIRELPYRTRRQALNKVIGIDNDKYGRALYLDTLFCQDRLFIPNQVSVVEGVSFESELCTVPDAKHDDRMDAVTFACALADTSMPRSRRVKVRAF